MALDPQDVMRTIGPYRIDGVIGDGGMGRVYRASREHDGIVQQVAIKLVRPERVNASLLQRFSTERRLLAALDHPNVCRFIDAGTLHDTTPYVVMELIDGEPLNAYCDRNQLTIPQRLQLLRKVLSAVAHAHRKLIVHRDIKAANVAVDKNGEPRLLDFGIAKSLADEHGSTATAERFFSPASAAPEQIRGDPVTVACDVYALGMLAYELLSGRMPFDLDGLSAGEVERLLLTVPPPPMSRRASDAAAHARGLPHAQALQRALHGDLDAVVLKCLRKSATDRYDGAEHLDAELARIQTGRPVAVRGGERSYRLRRFVSRNRTAVMLSAGLAIALIGGGVAIVRQNVETTAQRNAAVRERDRAQQIVELLQQSFATASPPDQDAAGVTATHVLDAARPRLQQLRDTQPGTYAALAGVVAKLDFDMQRIEQAAELAEDAVEAAREAGDRSTLRDALLLHGRTSAARQHVQNAERSFAEVEKLDGTPRVDWLAAKGKFLTQVPEREREGLALLRHAAGLANFASAAGDDLRLDLSSDMADALRAQGHLDEAFSVLDASIAWQEAHRGPRHPRVIFDRMRRVHLVWVSGQLDAAVRQCSDVLAMAESEFGRDSAIAIHIVVNRARMLKTIGRYAEAADTYADARARAVAVHGADHSQTLMIQLPETLMLTMLRRDVEAEASYRHLVATLDRKPYSAQNHEGQVTVRIAYANFMIERQRVHDALAMLATMPLHDMHAAGSRDRQFLDALLHVRSLAGCTHDRADPGCMRTAELIAHFQRTAPDAPDAPDQQR